MPEQDPLPLRLGSLSVRPAEAADQPTIEALFAKAFNETPPPGWYAWKYGPEGLAGRGMTVWSEAGELVAHSACFPRRLLWRGRSINAGQIGDMMVSPRWRGLLTRKGPFYKLHSTLFNAWVGHDKFVSVAYGFTHERAMRLGTMLGMFSSLGSMDLLRLPASAKPLSLDWRSDEIDSHDSAFMIFTNHAWQAMAQDFSNEIIGVRDAHYVTSRFVRRPNVRYRFLRVRRRWWRTSALLVLREAANELLWLDFIGPRSALPASVAAVRQFTLACGKASATLWASPAASPFFTRCGAQAAGRIAEIALIYTSACPDDTLSQRGWWLGGDTDFQ